MTEPLTAEVQGILDALSGAVEELRVATTGLEQARRDLAGLPRRRQTVEQEHEATATQVTNENAQASFESYGPHLQRIIGIACGDEEGNLNEIPPAETCEQIAELDARIKVAAGQPVVIIRPGRDWFDIGLLKRREHTIQPGLQGYYSQRDHKPVIELPVYDCVAIDRQTGQKPTDSTRREDSELRFREMMSIHAHGDTTTQPSIDPVNTHLLLTEEDFLTPVPQTNETTFILAGHSSLQRVLNKVAGFEFDPDSTESYMKFRTIEMLEENLKKVGIDFDPDFIDGYLAHRIHALETAVQEGGSLSETSPGTYQQTELAELRGKLARLTEAGWLSHSLPK